MTEELLEELEDMGAEVDDTIDRLMGDEDMYLEYLGRLPENQEIVVLRKAVEERDKDTAMKAVHTLKGVALNLGLLPLVDACMDMLLDFREDNEESAFEQMDTVNAAFEEWAKVAAKIKQQG